MHRVFKKLNMLRLYGDFWLYQDPKGLVSIQGESKAIIAEEAGIYIICGDYLVVSTFVFVQ